MINFVNIKDQDKHSRIAGAALEQGKWGFESGYNSDGDILVAPVDSDGDAGKDVGDLGLVMNYPVDREGNESVHYSIASGDAIIFAKAGGIEVEDDMLASKSTTTDWTGLSFGAELVVNADGYLTSGSAADAPSGATTVAKFMKIENGIVFYQTV